ncbi:MAG: hypothetical protein AAGE01_09540 [Pseudomonadota bacterium]
MKPLPVRIGIHIGLPKCASTSLQLRMIDASGANYLGKQLPGSDEAFLDQRLTELFRTRLPYDPAAAFDLASHQRVLGEIIAAAGADSRALMLSDELLSGIGFRNVPRRQLLDPETIFRRLAGLFAEPRVLIVVRSQMPFLRSYYAELVGHGYNAFFDTFLRTQLASPLGLAQVLRYDRYVALARRIFPEVEVVPFEGLVAGEPSTLDALERFGIDGRDLPRTNPSLEKQKLVQVLRSNIIKPRNFGLHTPLGDVADVRELERRRRENADPLYLVDRELAARWQSLSARANEGLEALTGWRLESP